MIVLKFFLIFLVASILVTVLMARAMKVIKTLSGENDVVAGNDNNHPVSYEDETPQTRQPAMSGKHSVG